MCVGLHARMYECMSECIVFSLTPKWPFLRPYETSKTSKCFGVPDERNELCPKHSKSGRKNVLYLDSNGNTVNSCSYVCK